MVIDNISAAMPQEEAMPAKATPVPPTGVLGRPVMDVIPGRWVGGVAMVIAPVLLLVGVLLRVQFHFFFPTSSRPSKPTRP